MITGRNKVLLLVFVLITLLGVTLFCSLLSLIDMFLF